MASTQYFIRDPEETYFLTMTVVDWVDVFRGTPTNASSSIRSVFARNTKG